MLAISIVNLVLSIFGITVSSIFILFWCGRYFCARFFIRRIPGPQGLFFFGTAHNRGVAERNSVGVNPLVIAYFPTITFHQDTFLPRHDAMCTVCLGEYKEEELLRMLPHCGHNFHATCIDAWLQRHATCPVCRVSLQGHFAGRTSAALPPTESPQPTSASQPMTSVIEQLVVGPNLRSLSEHSDASSFDLLSSRPRSLSEEALHHDNPTALRICISPSPIRPGPCDNHLGQHRTLGESGIDVGVELSVERG